MLPDVIDFRITGICNFNCGFCFGPSKYYGILTLDKIQRLLVNLKKANVKKIVLTGGEPTILPNIIDIIVMIKQLGFKLVLSTNASFFGNDNTNDILDNIDWIGLPIDSSDPHCFAQLRQCSLENVANIYKLFKYIKKEYPKLKIKIGTVVSNYNCDTIINIIDTLPCYPDVWKVYQLSESIRNKMFYNLYKISDKNFIELVNKIKEKYSSDFKRIFYALEYERDNKYIFCEPNGDAKTIYRNKEIKIGNFIDDFENTVQALPKWINNEKILYNFNNTYPD